MIEIVIVPVYKKIWKIRVSHPDPDLKILLDLRHKKNFNFDLSEFCTAAVTLQVEIR